MLFKPLKDAWLACKRCPLSPLLTPFWSSIKHLLLCCFITNWFPLGYKSVFYTCFCPCLYMLYLKLCNDFSKHCRRDFCVLKRNGFCVGGWEKTILLMVLPISLYRLFVYVLLQMKTQWNINENRIQLIALESNLLIDLSFIRVDT